MATYTTVIPLKLPSLNDYIRACRTDRRYAARFKREIEDSIAVYIMRLPEITKPVRISFLWCEENGRRDIDNVAAGKKFVLDALVKCGKLPDDNRKQVTGFADSFTYGKEASVTITIEEVEE
jgi:Holliday junction resolvase RusA-like endonuclease